MKAASRMENSHTVTIACCSVCGVSFEASAAACTVRDRASFSCRLLADDVGDKNDLVLAWSRAAGQQGC